MSERNGQVSPALRVEAEACAKLASLPVQRYAECTKRFILFHGERHPLDLGIGDTAKERGLGPLILLK